MSEFRTDAEETAYWKRIDDLNFNPHFQVLGYGESGTFFMLKSQHRIIWKKANQLRMPVFLELAPAAWWTRNFPPCKPGQLFDKRHALDFVFRAGPRAGEFELNTDPDAV